MREEESITLKEVREERREEETGEGRKGGMGQRIDGEGRKRDR